MNKEEAIEIIKRNCPEGSKLFEACMVFVPELRESKAERMKRAIVHIIYENYSDAAVIEGVEIAEIVAWLDKQKEPKPAEWSEDWREEDIQTRFAFYTYKDDPSTLYLSNVFVEEASRNHGFGTRILRAAEKVAETIGATTISLKVKQNTPANTWYRKNGYGFVAFEDGYDWLEKTLEYLKPKKEVEWSEEDDLYLIKAINIVVGDFGEDCDLTRWLNALPGRIKLQPQQEQPEVDLKKEIDEWCEGISEAWENGEWSFDDIKSTARHFFELGLKAKEGKK